MKTIGFIRYEPSIKRSKTPACYIRSYDGVYFTLLREKEGESFNFISEVASEHPEVEILFELIDDTTDLDDNDIDLENVDIESLMTTYREQLSTRVNNTSGNLPVKYEVTEISKPRKQVTFGPVNTIDDVERDSTDVHEDVNNDGWREAFNIDVIEEWQTQSFQLRELRSLVKMYPGDYQTIKLHCLKKKSLKKYARHVPHLSLNSEGVLVRKISLGETLGEVYPYLVPFSSLCDLVRSAHVRNGHIGREKLKRIVLPYVFHPNLYIVVSDITKSCEYCLKLKPYSPSIKPPIIKIQVQRPFELISVDLMELPHSSNRVKYVMNIIDHRTKWLASQPLRDKTSLSCAKAFTKALAGLPCLPESVISDNGTEFRGQPFCDVLRHFNINQKFITAYSPHCNGMAERVNQTLTPILAGLCKSPNEWDEYLPEAVIVYNNTYHTELNSTPSECVTSMVSKLPLNSDQLFWKPGSDKFVPYPVGSYVGKKIMTPRGVAKKLSPRYDGPFKVLKIFDNNKSYVLQSEVDPDREIRAHHNQLKPWDMGPKYLQRGNVFKDVIAEPETESKIMTDQESVIYSNVGANVIPGLDPNVNKFTSINIPFPSGVLPVSSEIEVSVSNGTGFQGAATYTIDQDRLVTTWSLFGDLSSSNQNLNFSGFGEDMGTGIVQSGIENSRESIVDLERDIDEYYNQYASGTNLNSRVSRSQELGSVCGGGLISGTEAALERSITSEVSINAGDLGNGNEESSNLTGILGSERWSSPWIDTGMATGVSLQDETELFHSSRVQQEDDIWTVEVASESGTSSFGSYQICDTCSTDTWGSNTSQVSEYRDEIPPEIGLLGRTYMTRSARARLFPGVSLDEALEL